MEKSNGNRQGLPEEDILSVGCPNCQAPPLKGCNMYIEGSRNALVYIIGSTRLAFHPERIRFAQSTHERRLFNENLTATDKARITYYAFIMICDSNAAKSEMIFGKKFTSEEIQMFFAQQAVAELRKDKLLP